MKTLSMLALFSFFSLQTAFSYENVVCTTSSGKKIDMDLGGNIKVIKEIEDGSDYNLAFSQSPNYGEVNISDSEEKLLVSLAPKQGFAFIYQNILNVGSEYNLKQGIFSKDLRFYFHLLKRKGEAVIQGKREKILNCYNI